MHRPPATLLSLLLLFAAGCGEVELSPIVHLVCTEADGRQHTVNISTSRFHCNGCNNRCMLAGVLPADQRCDFGCVLAPGMQCAPGYVDADGDPFNGCECRGDDPADCTPCTIEIPFNAVDDDCDLRIDERVPPALDIRPPTGAGYHQSRQPDRVHGPEGALRAAALESNRLACGGAPCALPPGALDVRCATVDAEQTCEAIWPAPIDLTTNDRPSGSYPGRAKRAPETVCDDGVDDDGNGVIDDGPNCETLVPAVPHPECHGAGEGADCPPTWVPLYAHPGLPGTDGPTVARMTYDALIDNREATVGQIQRWLNETGKCDRPVGGRHPLCDSTADPQSPAGHLDWCNAYEYCQWTGKRLPTELEWVQAFGGHHTATFAPVGGMCEGTEAQVPECRVDGPRPVGERGGHVDKGVGYISTLYDVAGNVAEWLFDARLEPCELPWIGCRAEGWQYVTPYDPVTHAPFYDRQRARILRGGGFGSELGAAAPDVRQWAEPGVRVPHYGVRCGRTFEPYRYADPLARPIDTQTVPYDRTQPYLHHAWCEARPRAGRIARRTPDWLGQAVEACIDSPLRPEPFRTLAAQLAWPVRPLLLNIDQTQSGSAVIFTALGLVPGSEALWLEEYPPVEGYSSAPCDPGACAMDLPGPGRWAIGLPGELQAIVHIESGRALAGTEPSCLTAADAAARWTFEVEVPRSALWHLPEYEQHTDAACTAYGCARMPPGDAPCATGCKSWRVPVHVAFEHLPRP